MYMGCVLINVNYQLNACTFGAENIIFNLREEWVPYLAPKSQASAQRYTKHRNSFAKI